MEEEGERHEGLELLAGDECPPPPHCSLLQSASSSSLLGACEASFSIGNETACGELAFTSSGTSCAGALNALLVTFGATI